MKKRIFEISAALALLICVGLCLSFEKDCRGIRDSVLRLHIIADSDSPEAQKLKLDVRDRILKESTSLFSGKSNLDEAKRSAEENLPLLESIAQKTVNEKGYTYTVSAMLTRCYFPTREYDGALFPAGEYEALRIVLGEGKGQNWWCVMFPALCLPAASEQDNLYGVLDEKGASIVTEPQKYRIRLWTVEKWYELKEYFESKST